MKRNADAERINATIPADVFAWLSERAKYHGSSLSAEITRSARERMERERAVKDREPASAAE
jgi:hypothetical protein